MNLSAQAKETLREFVLTDLEAMIAKSKKEIANLQIIGNHRKAEEKRRSLRFFWELHSELTMKIDNIEEKQP